MVEFSVGLRITLFAAGALVQERPPYGQEISVEQARKIAAWVADSKKIRCAGPPIGLLLDAVQPGHRAAGKDPERVRREVRRT